ncbi:hypothetical protein [Streptomyces aurantiogriseus]|uniref:Uncharacterized protein n=1 Tax=Streptomyces aurantiogriseus TaxID=66870 RepID=A0A918C8B2_9ACTN|nr:hypothetical protein [Streptomyces aurantiogriseus]GGR09786.1 hypothetical protein GCM10010251_27010 [Streptomyces aurantiogriseus]
MGALDVVVVLAAVLLVAGLGWFFFGPRRAGAARVEGGVQRVEVTVRGGYSPDLIRVREVFSATAHRRGGRGAWRPRVKAVPTCRRSPRR